MLICAPKPVMVSVSVVLHSQVRSLRHDVPIRLMTIKENIIFFMSLAYFSLHSDDLVVVPPPELTSTLV